MDFGAKKLIRRIFSLNKELISGYYKEDFEHLGNHCRIGPDCLLVPKNMYLDDYVIIQGRNNFISYQGKLVIKKYSVISSSCIIIPSNHILSVGVPFYINTLTHIGDDNHTIVVNEDVWIGAGCKLLPKSSFGRGCIVAAGSVVTKEVPPYAVVAGCPAKIIATKFSKEDIKEHEKRIYPERERMTADEIDFIFDQYFQDKKPLNSYTYSDAEKEILQSIVGELNMNITL